MPDNILDILIRFGLDKSKANEAAAAIKNLGEETKKVNQNSAEAARSSQDFSKTTQELEKNVTKATLATKEFEVSKRQLKESAKALKHEFPLVGTAIKLFTNPLGTSLGLLAAATAGFIEMRRHAKALAADVKFDDVSEAARRLAAAQQEVIDKSEDFHAKMREGIPLLAQIKSLTEDQAQILEDQAKATDDMAEAEDRLARAMLELQKAKGQITEEEAAQKEGALDKEKISGKTAREAKQRQALLDAAKDERDRLLNGRDALEGIYNQQRYGRMTAQIELERRVGERANVTAEVDALKAKQKSTGLRPDEYQRMISLQALGNKLDARIPDLQGRVTGYNTDIGATESALVSANQQIDQSGRKIAGMERRNNAANEAAAALAETNLATAGVLTEAKQLTAALRELKAEIAESASTAKRRTQ